MKVFLRRIFALFFCGNCVSSSALATDAVPALPAPQSLWELTVSDIDGNQVPLSTYKGKVVLVVNVASRCGFTGQYEGLEALYRKYKDRGFVVLGFPSNDFMGQEPGTNAEIKSFCKLNYDVSFPIFSKGKVTGDDRQPVFAFLTQQSGDDLNGRVLWNFEKFLVGKDGKLVDRWRSVTAPDSDKITGAIEKLFSEGSK